MIVTYDIYRRYAERDRESDAQPIEKDIYYGKRYELIQDFETLSLTLNWKKRSKFTIKGHSLENPPLIIGDSICIYRNIELFFTGIVDTVEVKCKDVTSRVVEWEASGEDESVIFDSRIVLSYNEDSKPEDPTTLYEPDPTLNQKNIWSLTFNEDIYNEIEGFARDRMIHYIRECFAPGFVTEKRAIKGLILPESSERMQIPEAERGKNDKSAVRMKKLSSVLDEIGKDDNLYARYQWNPITGKKEMTIPIQRDLSGMDKDKEYDEDKLVVISPEFGNVAKWSVTHKLPKFNAVWMCSGENKTFAEHAPIIDQEFLYDETVDPPKLLGSRVGGLTVYGDGETITGVKWDEEYWQNYAAEKAKYDEKIAYYDTLNKERKRQLIQNFFDEQGWNIKVENFDDNQIKSFGWWEWFDDISYEDFINRIWVYAEDEESIKKYGLIENVIYRNDIKVTEDEVVSDPVNGEQIVNRHDPDYLSEDDVRAMLKDEAEKALQENAAKDKYTVTIAETDELVFMRDWKCGDKVKVVIDGKEFASTIETVTVNYTKASEKVVPTVGNVEEGVFAEVFAMVEGMERRLQAEEQS